MISVGRYIKPAGSRKHGLCWSKVVVMDKTEALAAENLRVRLSGFSSTTRN
jgi:hypothetical protein